MGGGRELGVGEFGEGAREGGFVRELAGVPLAPNQRPITLHLRLVLHDAASQVLTRRANHRQRRLQIVRHPRRKLHLQTRQPFRPPSHHRQRDQRRRQQHDRLATQRQVPQAGSRNHRLQRPAPQSGLQMPGRPPSRRSDRKHLGRRLPFRLAGRVHHPFRPNQSKRIALRTALAKMLFQQLRQKGFPNIGHIQHNRQRSARCGQHPQIRAPLRHRTATVRQPRPATVPCTEPIQ